jgi:hypothetical protein
MNFQIWKPRDQIWLLNLKWPKKLNLPIENTFQSNSESPHSKSIGRKCSLYYKISWLGNIESNVSKTRQKNR